MVKLKVHWLALVFLTFGLLGWAVVLWTSQQGLPSPVLPPASLITLAGIGLVNTGLGVWVFLSKRRKIQARIHPMTAARVVVLGQAAAYGGALVAGWHAGILLYLLPAGAAGSQSTGWGWGYLIAGLALAGIGYLVEFLCKIDQDDDEDEETETSTNPLLGGIDPAEGESGYARSTHEG